MAVKSNTKAGKKQKSAPPPKKVKVAKEESDSDSDSSDDSSEEEMVVKPVAPVVKKGKTAVAKKKESSSDDSSDDSSEEETKPTAKKNGSNGAAKMDADSSDSDDSSESDSSDEEEQAPAKKPTPAKKAPAKKDESSSEESSSDEEEEKPAAKTVNKTAAKAKKEESSSSEEEDDSDESEEEAQPKGKTAEKKAPAKKEESSSEEEDSDEDSEEEEKASPKKRKPEKPVGKAPPAKKAKSSESSDEDSDDSEDDSDESESEEEEMEVEETPSKEIQISGVDADTADKKIVKLFKKAGVTFEGELRRDKGTCCVDLADPSQMEQALALSGTQLKGNAITVTKAGQKPAANKNTDKKVEKLAKKAAEAKPKGDGISTALFVGNLGWDLEEDDLRSQLHEHFKAAKEVRIPVKTDGSGEIKGFAFLDFDNKSDVDAILADPSLTNFNGRELRLDISEKKGSTPRTPKGGQGDGTGTALFVGNLGWDLEEDDLRSQLQDHFKGVKEVRIPVKTDGSGEIKGFAFLDFNNPSDLDAVFADPNIGKFNGRELRLDRSDKKGSAPRTPRGGQGGGFGGGDKSQTLFVKGLSYSATTDSLREAFSEVGCEDARVAMDRDTGDSKGFGFVDFDSVESAEAALQKLQNVEIEGRAVTLMFSSPRGGGGGGGRGGRGGRGGGRFEGRGSGGGSGCFKCGEEGHFSRECPQGGGGGRGGSRGRGGDRGGRGRGRGRGFGRGGFQSEAKAKNKGTIQDFSGKKKTFED